MYYAIVLLSVAMFGGCFALNDVYRKLRTSNLASSLESAFVGSLAGLAVLLIISGFAVQATPFTLLIAFLSAVSGIAFTFCSFKALDSANLSLYSLFSMLGGMALPFFQGILFYGEAITLSKIVCVILVCMALGFTVSREKGKKGGIYYIGVFVLNGMAGVLSKVFASAPYAKTDAQWFSIWIAVFTAVISGVLWLVFFRKKALPGYTWKAFSVSALSGSVNRVANFLLVIALAHLDASVQYPMVTGGVIIVSTLICFLGKNKPTKKEILSVLLAFLGMLALFLIKT
ncbi:MAG: DMT family transporter [Oscillospiraceae bacterium]|nr:DMT family transporter [Oscillospiraceae bacterium]